MVYVCITEGGGQVLDMGYSRNQYSRKILEFFTETGGRKLSTWI